MKLNRGLRVPALLGTLAILSAFGTGAARCQTTTATVNTADPVDPSSFDRTQVQAGARSLGMGGTNLIGNDVTYAAYNPASIARCGTFSGAVSTVGRSSNIHVDKINDLSKGLKDLGNQLNGSDNSLTGVRDAFKKVYNFSTNAGANDTTGSPATLTANLAPLAGFSVKNIGIVGYGSLAAEVLLTPQNIPVPGLADSPTGTVKVGYGVLGLTNVAIPFSLPLKVGTVGISPRLSEASYAGAGFLADETSTTFGSTNGVPNGSISGATYKEVHQQKFDVDLGFTSIPDPTYHVQGAVVVHNLFSPTYHLPLVVNGNSLGQSTQLTSFDFQMKPQIDLGILRETKGLSLAAELHNLGNVNGGKRSVHLGAEYGLGKMLFLRGGYDQSRFVVGLGLALGGIRLDVATGSKPQEQVALSLTFGGQ